MTQPTACVICSRRQPRTGMVCDPDRDRLSRVLGEIVELYALLPSQLMPGQATGPRVSGSREAPLPLRVDPLDLTMPARAGGVSDGLVPQYETVSVEIAVWQSAHPNAAAYNMRRLTLRQRQAKRDVYGQPVLGPSGDQDGHLSVAADLGSWVQDWRGRLDVGDVNPIPTVPELARWLSTWLDKACDDHPAMDECAGELFGLAATLRRICGQTAAQPELKVGVPCRGCDKVTLYRHPGSDYVECMSCPVLMTPDEYERWTQLIAMPAHRPWVNDIVREQRGAVSES